MVSLLFSGQMSFKDFILLLLFHSTEWYEVLIMALFMAGTWKMLEKSGLKGWWALFHGAREYQLSRCAGREPEGRVWSVLTVVLWIITLLGLSPDALPEDRRISGAAGCDGGTAEGARRRSDGHLRAETGAA